MKSVRPWLLAILMIGGCAAGTVDTGITTIPRSDEKSAHEYYVMGEVLHPGVYPLGSKPVTLKQALTAAGKTGWKWPNRSSLVRRTSSGGEEDLIVLNIPAVFDGTDEDIQLQDNDIVAVGTVAVDPLFLHAPPPKNVYWVQGDVEHPGRYTLLTSMPTTLKYALRAAQVRLAWWNPKAELVRGNQVIPLDVKSILSGTERGDVVKSGDVILVGDEAIKEHHHGKARS